MFHRVSTQVVAGLVLLAVQSLSISIGQTDDRVESAANHNWPAWRGPRGNGVSSQTQAPLRWSPTENVRWKVALPAPGNSTPILWGERLYLTSANADGAQRSLLCLHRDDGRLLWQRDVPGEAKELTHETNPYGASSPVTDGESIFVWHGSAGLWAYDAEGRERWHKDLGKFTHIWGYASSPVLVDDLVIVSCGPGIRCFLVAFRKQTGEEVWRRELPEAQAKEAKDFFGSWSTPVLHDPGGRGGSRQLLLSLPKQLRAFDPKTGEDVWTCDGLGDLAYTSVLAAGDIAVAMSGYHGPAIACRTTGQGNVTATHRLWRHDQKNPQRVGSGVIVNGHVYILNEPGIAWCLNLATGEKLWEHRLGGTSWSSMVHVADRIYAQTAANETFVLRPNTKQCEVLARNKLDNDITRASPIVSAGRIYIRGYKRLYCVEEK